MKEPKGWRNHDKGQGAYAKGLRTKKGDITVSSKYEIYRDKPWAITILGIVAMLIAALVIVALGLHDRPPSARVVAEVPKPEAGRTETLLHGVDLALEPQPTDIERTPLEGSIKFLGTTLYADGRLEVRGEVHLEKRSDLSSLHVKVTFDGKTGRGFIDANTRTWKVFFKPSRSLAPGERLSFEAVLVGRGV